jgi:predicted transglutaminase-like cysteine proteinase
VPRATFEMAMAQDLFNASQLYTPRKLDEPQKLAIFCQRAQEALKSVPESKESKELAAKIQNALKRVKKS